jgi:hypothetical protein
MAPSQAFTLGSCAQTFLGRGSHGNFFESKLGNAVAVIMGVTVAGSYLCGIRELVGIY